MSGLRDSDPDAVEPTASIPSAGESANRAAGAPPSLRSGGSVRVWLLFVGAIVASVYVHEIGHCAVAWAHGCPAIPTPAKEYLLRPLPPAAQNGMALGGILGSVGVLIAAVVWLHRRPNASRSALLAGAMVWPGFYTLRFILAGRGHDATEFQEAQAALGLDYSGHAVDWLFLGLFVVAAVAWFWQTHARPTRPLAARFVLGAVAGLVVVVLLQSVNNMVFDPLFEPKPKGSPSAT